MKSNLFEDTIIGGKQDFKAGKPALTEALKHNQRRNKATQNTTSKLCYRKDDRAMRAI